MFTNDGKEIHMKPELLTIPQFCKLANCGTTRAYQLISSNEVRAVKMGRRTLIPRKAFNDWIDSLTSYSSQEKGDE